MNKPFPIVPVLLGLGIIVVGGILFWPGKAKAALVPKPQPQPLPPPKPAAAPPAPSPIPAPAPVPIPPKLDTGPGAQIEYPLLVTGDGVNVRTGPSTSYPVITTVNKGTRLQLPHSNSWSGPTAGAPQGWNGVLLPNGRTGWIASQFLTIPAS
jgi:hypothetical protein